MAFRASGKARKFRYLVIMCRPGTCMDLARFLLLPVFERRKNSIKAEVGRNIDGW
jgi:hypothetical protein